jgi:hypothetical protein
MGLEIRALAQCNRENAPIRFPLCVYQHVIAEATADFARTQGIGDDAAEFGVDCLGGTFQSVIGEEGHYERSSAHAARRIVNQTNLHGGPFER